MYLLFDNKKNKDFEPQFIFDEIKYFLPIDRRYVLDLKNTCIFSIKRELAKIADTCIFFTEQPLFSHKIIDNGKKDVSGRIIPEELHEKPKYILEKIESNGIISMNNIIISAPVKYWNTYLNHEVGHILGIDYHCENNCLMTSLSYNDFENLPTNYCEKCTQAFKFIINEIQN